MKKHDLDIATESFISALLKRNPGLSQDCQILNSYLRQSAYMKTSKELQTQLKPIEHTTGEIKET